MAKNLITTPIGTAVYPHIENADIKYVAEGVYSVKLRFTENDAAPLLEQLQGGMASALDTAKKDNPGKRVKQADAPWQVDDDTGDVLINFKLKASGKTKEGKEFTQRVAVFDAKGKPFLNSKIGGGSRLRVSFEMGEFYTALIGAGVTLRLRAVQVISYNEYGDRDAKGYGFGEEQDGFMQDGAATTAAVETAVSEAAPAGPGAGDDF